MDEYYERKFRLMQNMIELLLDALADSKTNPLLWADVRESYRARLREIEHTRREP